MAAAARVPLQSQSLRREEPEAGGQSKRAPRGRTAQGQACVLEVHGGGAVLVVAGCPEPGWVQEAARGQSRTRDVALEVQGFGHCTGAQYSGRCIGAVRGAGQLTASSAGSSARSASAASASRRAQRVPELRLETCRAEPALPR